MKREEVKEIRDSIIEKLKEIESKHNVKIELGTVKFDSLQFKTVLTVSSEKSEHLEESENLNDFLSKRYGFTQNIIGMVFDHPSLGKVTIKQFKPRNRKYPILGECAKGLYKFDTSKVKSLLGGDKMINRRKNLENLTK